MNRVYKVIWNKVKGQYVVVSELAHRCTKSAGHTAGRRAAAIAAACLCFGWGSAWAADVPQPEDPYMAVLYAADSNGDGARDGYTLKARENSVPEADVALQTYTMAGQKTSSFRDKDGEWVDEEKGNLVNGISYMKSTEGQKGNDSFVTVQSLDGELANFPEFNLITGSTVRGNLSKEALTETESKGELDTLTINGQTYTLREYAAGKGINIEGSDGKYTVSVKAADDNIDVSSDGVGLNQKEVNIGGIKIVGNRDENDENHDNNTIQGLSNTTWDKKTMDSVSASLEVGGNGEEASKAATQGQLLGAVNMAAAADKYLHNGTENIGPNKTGYKVNDDGTVTMTVASDDNQDTESVVIGNIASKTALDSLDDFAVKYDPGDDGANYDRVTLGTIYNKYNTKDHTGGTTITNVAYSDGTGSDAVNVDYLRDYVTANSGGSWDLTTNGGVGDGNTAVSIGNGATVDFSGVTKTIGEGEDETTQSNIVVNKTTENGTTKVAFDLAKDLNVTTITATNQYVTNVTEEDDNSVTNIAYVTGHERHIATSGDVNPDDGKQFSGEYYVNRADGTISLIEVDGNGNPTSNTLVLKDIASATDLKNLDAGVVKYDTVNGTIDYSTVTLKGDGDKGTTITNLANGEVSVTSTDAVNGSQLFEVQELAGKHTTMTVNGDVSAPAIPEGDTEGAYTDGNLQLKQKVGDKGQIEYDVKLNDDIVLGGTDGSASRVQIGGTNGTIMVTKNADNMDATTTIDGGNIYAGSSVTVGDTVKLTDKDITGLSNTTWNGTTDDASRAATEGQLQTVSDTVNAGWIATDDKGNKIAVNPEDNTLNFSGDRNVTVEANTEDGSIDVSLNDDIVLGGTDGSASRVQIGGTNGTIMVTKNADNMDATTTIDGGNIYAGSSVTVGDTVKLTDKDITGLSNTTWNGTTDDASRAATEGQLQTVSDKVNGGWTATDDAGNKINVNPTNSTLNFASGKNVTVNADAEDDEISVDLNDDLLLGSQVGSGSSIAVTGTDGSIILNSVSESGSNSIEINAAQGTITGLTNAIGEEGWNTFSSHNYADGSRAVTADDLYQVYQHGVQYAVNEDGTPNYSQIILNGAYNADTHEGGTAITHVAYAGNVTDGKGNVIGSAAVNVDYLNDQLDGAKQEVTNADQHLDYNKDYSVDKDKHKVNLDIVDNQGNVVGNTSINDVASAEEVGSLGDLNEEIAHDSTGDGKVSIVDAVNNVDNKVGNLEYKHDDGSDLNYVTAGDSVTDAIGDLDAAIKDAASSAAANRTEVASGDSNIIVEDTNNDKDGKHAYNVSLNPDLKVDTVTASGNISAGSFTTGDITINAANDDGTHTGTINGLSNKTWDADNIVSGQAATEDQLKAATEGAVQYDRNEDGTVNKGSITLGGPTYNSETHKGGTTITNVADGQNASDAVNMSQLWQTNQAVINNSNNIQMLSNSVNKLDNRIDRVGAGAAALAALHPLDFDPDAKWDFAAGYGNYRGASAVAMGAYYRPNEDVMLSVGGSMGGGENMVNAGVSIKLGAGSSHVSTSRVAMAKEIESLRGTVAQLTALVNTMVGSQHRIQNELSTEFPDVPENHWAYEAVETLAKSGLAVGYPDGQFKGDRSLTRYEFAEIVHRALQAGVGVDARLVEEFKPELEFFRIDTITTDADDNPVIQRVRVNK